MSLAAIAVVAVVFAHYGLTAADALSRGMFNFDSLWYHMPFAVEMAKSHSVTGIHYTETVFTNWFYPQNSELLHAVGILLTERDTLSLFLNFGWLAVALLAAWCIGRPYGVAPLAVVAAAIVLDAHTLVVREPGAAKNDLMAAALLLAAVAILVNAVGPRVLSRRGGAGQSLGFSPGESATVRDRERGKKEDAAPVRHPPSPPPAGGAGSADAPSGSPPTAPSTRVAFMPVGWPLAAAGLATGLAVGTKSTALAMAAALTLAVIALAPAGRRWAAAAWWFLPALAGGGYWYLRNLVIAGNPLPQLESLGPISLPHPERLQNGRPDFSIAHYATDMEVWRDYFGPGLENAFGVLWPLVVAGAIAGGLLALLRGRERVIRWMGVVALFALVAYLFTPLSAAGAEGMPEGFRINIRYAIPALLAALTLLPLALHGRWRISSARGAAEPESPPSEPAAGGTGEPESPPSDPAAGGAGESESRASDPAAGGVGWGARREAASSFSPHPQPRTAAASSGEKPSAPPGTPPRDRTRGQWAWSQWVLLAALLVVFALTNRVDAVLRDADRLLAWAVALVFVLIPAALLLARRLGASRRTVAAGLAALAIAVLAIGYPLQRNYLEDRFANEDPAASIPGMGLDSAYRWARGVEDARIGLAGTTAGFLQYGFYGTDLSNRVRYLGRRGPHGAFDAIPACREFRAAVNAADLDYLVTAPFLNFIEPEEPIRSPEAGWLRGAPQVRPVDRGARATVWRVGGRLDPAACGPANAPLRRVPDQPAA